MLLTHRLERAINTAALLHRDHTRIGSSQIPYITHLVQVLILVSQYTAEEDTLIAALLHDSVEDVPEFTSAILERDYGSAVATLVASLTEERVFNESLGTRERWLQAKKSYLSKLSVASDQAHLISASDKINNMRSILLGYQEKDEVLMRRFDGQALQGQVWFAGQVMRVVTPQLPPALGELYFKTYAEFKVLADSLSTKLPVI